VAVNAQRPPVDAAAYKAAIAAEVRAAMARVQVQQKEMETLLGWGRNYMNKRYTGKTPFSIPDLTAICDELGIDMGDLIGRAKRAAMNGDEPTANAS